jgi:hypothetical protein
VMKRSGRRALSVAACGETLALIGVRCGTLVLEFMSLVLLMICFC